MSEARDQLAAGVEALGLELPDTAIQKLVDYLEHLARWNRVHNLTAVREVSQMVPRHLLDSLAVLPHVNGPRLIDVGSGAGLPGVPLAIADPGIEVCLLDSRGKRIGFLRHVKTALGLDNVSVVHSRVEDYRAERRFDTVIAPAFSSISNLLAAAGHLCAANGRVLAMKGAYPGEEIAAMPAEWRLQQTLPLRIPLLDGQRHLLVFEAESSE